MKNLIKAYPIMLPTEKSTNIYANDGKSIINRPGLDKLLNLDTWTAQHIHLYSDERLIHPNKGWTIVDGELVQDCIGARLVIASTDSSLGVDGIPGTFIGVYGKSKCSISEVQVEQDSDYVNPRNTLDGIKWGNKTRPDGTIVIHPAKTYTLDEVKAAFEAGCKAFYLESLCGYPLEDVLDEEFDKFINNN